MTSTNCVTNRQSIELGSGYMKVPRINFHVIMSFAVTLGSLDPKAGVDSGSGFLNKSDVFFTTSIFI